MTWPNTKMVDAYNASRADVPVGTRRLQEMVDQSKAKMGEENPDGARVGAGMDAGIDARLRRERAAAKLGELDNAQVVRGSTPMTLEDYRKAQGRLSDLSGPAVTLEGLAAVIGSLSEALQSLYGSNSETKATVAALVKAADAVTALLTTEVHDARQNSDWTERHAAKVAADIAAREASGQAEENRKARTDSNVRRTEEDNLRDNTTRRVFAVVRAWLNSPEDRRLSLRELERSALIHPENEAHGL